MGGTQSGVYTWFIASTSHIGLPDAGDTAWYLTAAAACSEVNTAIYVYDTADDPWLVNQLRDGDEYYVRSSLAEIAAENCRVIFKSGGGIVVSSKRCSDPNRHPSRAFLCSMPLESHPDCGDLAADCARYQQQDTTCSKTCGLGVADAYYRCLASRWYYYCKEDCCCGCCCDNTCPNGGHGRGGAIPPPKPCHSVWGPETCSQWLPKRV